MNKDVHDQNTFREYTADECVAAIRLLKARIDQLTSKEYQAILSSPITDLNLSVRAWNILGIKQLYTVGEIISYGIENLYKERNCGDKTLKEISAAIDRKLSETNQAGELLELKIELGDKNDIWGWVNMGNCLITTVSDTVTGVIDNIRMQIKDHQEHELKGDEKWSKVDPDAIRFKIRFEIN